MVAVNNAGLDLDKLGITSTAKASEAKANAKQTLGQADFLKLLTTQLKNQDPLKPIDNENFVAQMAQFSSLQGISDMNATLKSMAGSLESSRIGGATGYVGKFVLVPGNKAEPDASGGVYGTLDLPSSASNVTVAVKNPAGAVVRTLALGAADKGELEFEWDGKNAAGQSAGAGPFTLEATGLVAGKQESLATSVYGRVRTVNLPTDGKAMTLDVAGVGAVPFDKVRKITG